MTRNWNTPMSHTIIVSNTKPLRYKYNNGSPVSTPISGVRRIFSREVYYNLFQAMMAGGGGGGVIRHFFLPKNKSESISQRQGKGTITWPTSLTSKREQQQNRSQRGCLPPPPPNTPCVRVWHQYTTTPPHNSDSAWKENSIELLVIYRHYRIS